MPTEHEDTLPDANDDEVPQEIHDGGNAGDQSLHNSISQECDVQPFTFIDPLAESHDGLSQDHGSPEHTILESEVPSGAKKRRRKEKPTAQPGDRSTKINQAQREQPMANMEILPQTFSQLSSASYNIYMDTLKRAQVATRGMKGRPSKVVVSEKVLNNEIGSASLGEAQHDYNGESDDYENMLTDEVSKHSCKRCDAVFDSHRDLMQHVTTLDGKPRLNCRSSREGLEAKNFYGGKKKTDHLYGMTSDELKKFKEWRDASIAKCAICGWEESRSKFGQHLKQWHDMLYGHYKTNHGSSVHMLREHQCRFCGQFIELELNELQYHFKNKHNTSTVDYYKKYISGTAKDEFVDLASAVKTEVNDKQSKMEIPTRGEMDTVFDKCEFFCRICPMEYYSAQNLKTHLKSHPGITREKLYRAGETDKSRSYTINKQYGPLRTKSVRHNCLICNNEIFHTKVVIDAHLKQQHQDVTLHEYYKMYIGDKSALAVLSRMRSEIFKANEEAAKLNRDFDKCEYFCRICNAEFWLHSKLVNHINRIHQHVTDDEYKEQYGPLMTKLTLHKCGLCGHSFRHTKTYIVQHLKKKHESDCKGLSLEMYQKRYINGHWYNRCWFDCRACHEKYTSQSDLENHIQLYHIFKNIHEYKNSLGPLKTTSCRICHDKFFSQSKLEYHIQREHMFENIDTYVATLGALMTKSDTHECRMCNKIIYCTESVVLEHLTRHGISLEDYNEKFMNVGAGAVDEWSGANEDSAIRDDSMKGSTKEEDNYAVSTATPAPDCPFECTFCNRKFQNKAGLNGHLRVHLVGPRPKKQL